MKQLPQTKKIFFMSAAALLLYTGLHAHSAAILLEQDGWPVAVASAVKFYGESTGLAVIGDRIHEKITAYAALDHVILGTDRYGLVASAHAEETNGPLFPVEVRHPEQNSAKTKPSGSDSAVRPQGRISPSAAPAPPSPAAQPKPQTTEVQPAAPVSKPQEQSSPIQTRDSKRPSAVELALLDIKGVPEKEPAKPAAIKELPQPVSAKPNVKPPSEPSAPALTAPKESENSALPNPKPAETPALPSVPPQTPETFNAGPVTPPQVAPSPAPIPPEIKKPSDADAMTSTLLGIPLSRQYRIMLVGDSLMDGLGLMVRSTPIWNKDKMLLFITKAKTSTGLSNVNYWNWPAKFREFMEQYRPDLVVFLLGANDAQGIVGLDKKSYLFNSETWQEKYRGQAAGMIDTAVAGGADVIWLGLPVMGSKFLAANSPHVARQQREACLSRNVLYVETTPAVGGPNGEFRMYAQNAKGKNVRIRTDDKCHFTAAGYLLILDALRPYLKDKLAALDARNK